MKTKLTLSISNQLVRTGKHFAQSQDKSLSELVEDFLRSLQTAPALSPLDPRVASLYGSYKLPKDLDIDSLRLSSLLHKHLS